MSEFMTVEYLATFAGMIVALGLIVQFTKSVVKRTFTDQLVRLYTFIWACVLVGIVYWNQGQFNCSSSELAMVVLLALVNAIIITLAAMGGYEAIADPRAYKQR